MNLLTERMDTLEALKNLTAELYETWKQRYAGPDVLTVETRAALKREIERIEDRIEHHETQLTLIDNAIKYQDLRSVYAPTPSWTAAPVMTDDPVDVAALDEQAAELFSKVDEKAVKPRAPRVRKIHGSTEVRP